MSWGSPVAHARRERAATWLSRSACGLPAAKWLALFLMIGDHVNKYALQGQVPMLYELGRLAMPLFVFAFAYNLSRPGVIASEISSRVQLRLWLFGGLAAIPHAGLGATWGWWPLNIMFTLLVSLWLIEAIASRERRRMWIAAGLFVAIGAVVEFFWPALVLALSSWLFWRQPSLWRLAGVMLALGAVGWVNGNPHALVAIPVLGLLSALRLRVPRAKGLFYTAYPAHLLVLWMWNLVGWA